MTHEEMFQTCIRSILEHEGGLSMDKRDPGGTTNWGISLRYLKAMGLDLNGDGIVDDEDIITMPVEGAVEIYRKHWWDKYRYAAFNELQVVEKVFDMAVNMGARTAHRLLQESINRIRPKALIVDGLLGGKTFGAANSLDASDLRLMLRLAAKNRYEQILKVNPAMEWARKGWMKRAAW